MTHCALYARVATDAFPETDELKAQVELLEAFAQQHGQSVDHIYLDVGSGLSEDRPGLQALMADAKAQRFDAVLMRDPTRLFRDWSLFQEYSLALRQECGVRVVFVYRYDPDEDGDA